MNPSNPLNLDEDKMREINKRITRSPVEFAELVLGVTLHQRQRDWIVNSTKRINILRPGNRWGKTVSSAIMHLWHCLCKPNLQGRVRFNEDWLAVEYQTLNFGPTYELGRGALLLARDIAQGAFLLPNGTTNKSMLKDWAITDDRSEANSLPSITFLNGSKLLGRSMAEMGVAFKMKSLAYISGDECADIPELWTFTNNTLLPRLVSLDGNIHLVGTPQPEGTDYMRMIEMCEEDMGKPEWDKDGLFYTQRGTMYENVFLGRSVIEDIERIADPIMRQQIIYGDYVETGEKYFGFERIQNAVDKDIQLEEQGRPDRRYITSADFAGGDSAWADFTVILTIDYTDEPYRIVAFQRFKGGDISIPMQYKMVEEQKKNFPGMLIIDTSALGGKNALAFLGHLSPISFDMLKNNKAEMLATVKIALDGGQSKDRRREREYINGAWKERNREWGLLKIPDLPVIVSELQNYKLEDKKLRTDCVMALAMAIHWIEMRRPRVTTRKPIELDWYSDGFI